MRVQKGANEKQEYQGSVGLSNGAYDFDTWVAEKQADTEIRRLSVDDFLNNHNKMRVQKGANEKQEYQGSVGLSNGAYAFDTWVAEKQADTEIRRLSFDDFLNNH